MKLLTELLKIKEAEEEVSPVKGGPLELVDVVKNFPNKAQKAVRALLDKNRLYVNGQEFFEFYGNVIVPKASRAVKGYKVEMDVLLDGTRIEGLGESEVHEFELEVTDSQEVYCGYDAGENTFYVGFDAWTHEEDFNDQWDKSFKEVFGVPYEHDDSAHEAVFNKAWKEYSNNSSFSILVTVDMDGTAEVFEDGRGIFYPKGFQALKSNLPDIIDLRLD